MVEDEWFQFALEVCNFLLESPHFLLALSLCKKVNDNWLDWKDHSPAGKEEYGGRGTPARGQRTEHSSARSWSGVEIAHSKDADAPDSRRRRSFGRSR
jgi:hypothetical protein